MAKPMTTDTVIYDYSEQFNSLQNGQSQKLNNANSVPNLGSVA